MSGAFSENFPDQLGLIKKLSETAWRDAEIKTAVVDRWLGNFTGACSDVAIERSHAIHLLAQHIFVGQREIDECLRVVFDDWIAYPFVQKNKASVGDPDEMGAMLRSHLLKTTRFVGVGNPAESGASFLCRFRQANGLPLGVFSTACDTVDIREDAADTSKVEVLLDPGTLDHLVFLDDFCGSGTQAPRRIRKLINLMRRHHGNVRISFFLLFATESGLLNLEKSNLFDEVKAVILFDDDYKVFCDNSHYYRSPVAGIDLLKAREIMQHYGRLLVQREDESLGFGDCQLLLSFQHNTPNNTLPVIWTTNPNIPWHGIFPRFEKVE